MTNYEKYKDDIIKTLFIKGATEIDKKTGEFRSCCMLDYCNNCQFDGDRRFNTFLKWLDSEYVELEKEEVDWSKVPIDTKVLVSDDNGNWVRSYFAGYDRENKVIYTFPLGATSWTNDGMGRIEWKYVKLYKEDGE